MNQTDPRMLDLIAATRDVRASIGEGEGPVDAGPARAHRAGEVAETEYGQGGAELREAGMVAVMIGAHLFEVSAVAAAGLLEHARKVGIVDEHGIVDITVEYRTGKVKADAFIHGAPQQVADLNMA